jgi:serine/threonine-protein kinase
MIRVVVTDLAGMTTEGVLRSIASDLAADTPLSRTLELRAGARVAERLQAMGTLPVGAAVITPGGDLAAGFLIHVVLQSPEEPVRAGGVRSALVNGLRRAQEWGLESLALPPLGMGAGNLQAEDSAAVMVPVIQDHLQRHEYPNEVVIVVANDYEEDVFLRAVELARRQSSAREN